MGYIEFARLEYYADAINSAIVNPAGLTIAGLLNAYRRVINSHREFHIARL